MTEAEKQRARVDALIVWVEERLETLTNYGTGSIPPSELIFPDPHRTADAPESEPRRNLAARNAAAALAFLENDK
ncbi:hypothetical protein ACFYY3_08315 [Streptomyces sp. NPDC001812]|uniref:hypothetical protein n=1 Tax=Streptomyces sp. NPDC001812 TaxID=3364611 RepID=UPI0036BFFF0A